MQELQGQAKGLSYWVATGSQPVQNEWSESEGGWSNIEPAGMCVAGGLCGWQG